MNPTDNKPGHLIEGIWSPVRGSLNGDPVPEMLLRHLTLTLHCGRYEIRFAEELQHHGSYKLSTFDSPYSTLTLYPDSRFQSDSGPPCFPSIYQLKGDRLRICYALDGKQPADFQTQPGSQRYLITYRRIGLTT